MPPVPGSIPSNAIPKHQVDSAKVGHDAPPTGLLPNASVNSSGAAKPRTSPQCRICP